jgi:predicted PurR-regulated permease PerM
MVEKNDKQDLRHTVNVNIRPYTVVRTVFVAVMTILALSSVTKMQAPITLILTSFFLAIALNPPVSKISKFMPKGSRALSVAVAYLLVVGFLSGLLFTVVPPVAKQVGNFANQLPSYTEDLRGKRETRLAQVINKYGLEDDAERFANKVKDTLGNSGEVAFRSAQTALSALVSTITVLVLTFFMLVDGPIMLSGMLARYKDEDMKRRHEDLLKKMYRVVTGYFNGQVLVASIASGIALLIMLLVGWIFKTPLPYPLVLTSVVFICGLIPLVGATLGASIVVLISTFVNWKVAIVLGVYFFIYQQVENATIQPKIQSKAVSMNPLIVLIVVMLSASLGGIFAAFVALPVAGCLQLLFNDFISQGSLVRKPQETPNNWLSRSIRMGSSKNKN